MPVPFVTCKHEVTGAVADLPETGVKHFPGWVPVDQDQADAVEAPAPAPAAKPEPASPTKSKAASTATIEKE
jgi:hypothetical protein